ncbi:MAG: methionine--tRNA ligase [Candidatus Schekmanbacteria bacterium]|nr:methionine--tRNA ligase [Candidatus Schekmanbacteria bacterium]
MTDKFFITTPIYYVNDVPHIGHAYTSIACDVMARFKRLQGKEVLFSTGTDEHGQKVEKAASEKGEKPIELADRVVERFKSLWQKLDITHNDFIRTTEPRHKDAVTNLFKKIMEKGDIYKGFYEDWYCTPCETFWTEMQLAADGNCPDCGRKTEKLKEESYFFRLSKYAEPLLSFYEKNPGFIAPESRKNEIISFVKGGLKDLSISRTSFNWGIPVPGDEKHVIYVWFDALINYLTVTGFPSDENRFRKTWPCDVHVIGKDILRFHAVFWPAFLLSADIEPPKKVFAHGWWTVDGKKMSKSLMNVVEPNALIDEFGVDTVRYFLLREVPFGLDGDFSRTALTGRFNSDLANDLGNLFSRSITMIIKYRDGKVPQIDDSEQCELSDKCLCERASKTFDEVIQYIEELSFSKALASIWVLLNEVNRYIDKKAPWQLAKKGDDNELDRTLDNIFRSLKVCTVLLTPFMPEKAHKMWALLGLAGKPEELAPITLAKLWAIDGKIEVNKPEALFPRIETAEAKPEKGVEKSGEKIMTSDAELLSIDDFKKIKIRTAKVLSAEKVPKSDKLLKLTVDDGEKERTIVAGISLHYKPEDIVGKTITIVVNLKPAKLMGVESNGMLLAASDDKTLSILTTDREVKNGSPVK